MPSFPGHTPVLPVQPYVSLDGKFLPSTVCSIIAENTVYLNIQIYHQFKYNNNNKYKAAGKENLKYELNWA